MLARIFGFGTHRTSAVQWPEEPLDLPTSQFGGYYAAKPGLVFQSRYRVVNKLGWGQHSSVWLAEDQIRPEKPVAIKILSAHATEVQSQVAFELAILERIKDRKQTKNHLGRTHVLSLIDHFKENSPHGEHLCLVTEVLGSTLAQCQQLVHESQFPIVVVKTITRQLLMALDFLHSDCGIVHTDIKSDNIQFVCRDVTAAVTLSEEACRPEVLSGFPIPTMLSRPLKAVTADDLLDPVRVRDLQVKLTDFGTAAFIDGQHAELIQPAALRAPEVILGCGWGPKADIWNLGCVVFELLTGTSLFRLKSGPSFSAEQYHLGHMPGFLGDDFASHVDFLKKGKHFAHYFDDDGKCQLRCRVSGALSLDQIFKEYGVLQGDAERAQCVDFLKSMLRISPDERKTAKELLMHPWLA
ncbi:Serine/threonine-protein kinase SRPK [Grifola frondosa]|uniref:non-specific serine/threonine protein kinase n=1 Tax=Grifola frondosa TaxID=5627 RepID=A0A1C7MSG4_GRIFR|nr:Serine/threonine-protein kinase SRPK [Grifola frondosa]